jgi:hypothetical protein
MHLSSYFWKADEWRVGSQVSSMTMFARSSDQPNTERRYNAGRLKRTRRLNIWEYSYNNEASEEQQREHTSCVEILHSRIKPISYQAIISLYALFPPLQGNRICCAPSSRHPTQFSSSLRVVGFAGCRDGRARAAPLGRAHLRGSTRRSRGTRSAWYPAAAPRESPRLGLAGGRRRGACPRTHAPAASPATRAPIPPGPSTSRGGLG